MDTDKADLQLKNFLPSEIWAHIISFLPRITRKSLAELNGFKELIEDTNQLENRRLYQALKNGNLTWRKVSVRHNMQPRLRHGTINFLDQLHVFGGASSNIPTSGTYNDVWKFDFINKFHRMTTLGQGPSPRANFGFVRTSDRIFVVGGRTSNFDPFQALQNPFEIHMLNTKTCAWQRILTTGTEPQYSNGVRCVMLSSQELVAVAGLIPTFQNWLQEVQPDGNFEHFRTSMQVSVLKFDATMERGQWHRIADWQQNRRNFPTPRAEFHMVSLGDNILICGGRSTNHVLQDAWLMRIQRNPSYSVKFTQIAIENPFVPSLPLHLFPSCLVGDLLVFTGARTIMKKPGIEKPKEEAKKSMEPAPSPPQDNHRRTPIFINLERPLNTIGAMAAFSVSRPPQMPPQKVLKVQTPEPPEPPKRLLQDYPMRIFCLDLSNIASVSDDLRNPPMIRWYPLKNDGLYSNAPELRALGSFTQFEKGIVHIGGVRRSQTDDDVLFTQATNEVYMLDYVHDGT